MDRIRDSYGLDNSRPLAEQKDGVSTFYGHPVLLMNALYTDRDPVSRDERWASFRFEGKKFFARVNLLH